MPKTYTTEQILALAPDAASAQAGKGLVAARNRRPRHNEIDWPRTIRANLCTPDRFPDLIAAAISRQDIDQWAAQHNIVTAAHAPR